MWIQSTIWDHLHSGWRISFSISCKAGPLATSSVTFYLSWIVSISPSFFKGIFPGYRILDWAFVLEFLFWWDTFSIWLSHLLLASKVFDKTTAVILLGFPYVIFLLLLAKFLFAFGSQHFYYGICLFVDLFVFILLGVAEIFECVDCFSIYLGSFSHKVFKYLSGSFPILWYSHYTWHCCVLSHISLRVHSFFFIPLLSALHKHNLYQSVFKFASSFFWLFTSIL